VLKFILVLLIGIAVGYSYGFKDAKKHKKDILERTVERVGGKNRGAYDTNLDKRADAVTR
jgi:hypothetical protein